MTTFLLLYWYQHAPRYALVEDEAQARKFAEERNAVLIPIGGDDVIVGNVRDYYYRDERGNPRPAIERDLMKYPYRQD